MSETSVAASNWNADYESGRYAGEPAIPFVETIANSFDRMERARQLGLYVGCGNGRNYLPLRNEHGLRLMGMDISSVAIDQLYEADPSTKEDAFVGDFADYKSRDVFDYVVAIQVFQHGNRETVNDLFAKTNQVLKKHGRLFLRVNSIGTDMAYDYTVTEETNEDGGQTVRYDEGPKAGQEIHFFSDKELGKLAAQHSFKIIQPALEVVEDRKPPLGGSWKQWETIWQKAA